MALYFYPSKTRSPLYIFFIYKQFIFDPRPENCLSFSKKLPQKNCSAIV